MDYFIDDMLGPPRRSSSTKSAPTSPAPALSEKPPFPTPTRIKKSKTVTFPTDAGTTTADEKSRSSTTSTAAKVALPDNTPTSSSVRSQTDGRAASEANLLSPKAQAASKTGVHTDYFSAAELAPRGDGSASLRALEPATPGASVFFTPMSELPVVPPEMPQSAEEPAAPPQEIVQETSAVEQQDPVTAPEEHSAAAKEIPGSSRTESPPPMLHISPTPASPSVTHDHPAPAIMIGLSGAPASGKTTLAHLLSAVLPRASPSFLIHQDDFFIRKHVLIPDTDIDGDGEKLDVSYRRTVDFSAFKKLLGYAKREGRLPTNYRGLQQQEEERE
ncbi:MAG: hypothetical protein L6R39_007034, partial [Caloplaca ligustica]